MFKKRVKEVYVCHCERCKHIWESDILPKSCSKCKSRSWNVPKRSKK